MQSRKIKTNGYNSSVLTAKRNRKRNEAEDRQAEYNSLTTEEKLTLARKRGGSKREVERLEKRLEWEKAQAVTAKVKKTKAEKESPKAETEKKPKKTAKKPAKAKKVAVAA